MTCRQAVVLCGGLGTRLGDLTRATPKPLLGVGGVPFLRRLLVEVRRHGIRNVVLLASYRSEAVKDFVADLGQGPLADITVDLVIEPERAGTGGALWHARDHLDECFFLLNGDSWFDINLWDLAAGMTSGPDMIGRLALRRVPDASRYGIATLSGERIVAFCDGTRHEPALVNGGVYFFKRELLDWLAPSSSLEIDALPRLASAGKLTGIEYPGFFIDIGVPLSFAEAQMAVPERQRRSAVILCPRLLRHGPLTDHDQEGSRRFDAVQIIRRLNDAGVFVFVLNDYEPRSGQEDIGPSLVERLSAAGAHIDGIGLRSAGRSTSRSPTEPFVTIRCSWPEVLDGLLSDWGADRARSMMIGAQAEDLRFAEQAGIRSMPVDRAESLDDLATRPPVFGD